MDDRVSADPDRWLSDLASALDVQGVSREETGAILRAAREVAHGVERKLAPVSTFLLGLSVGRRTGEGASREEAFERAVASLRAITPEPPEEEA